MCFLIFASNYLHELGKLRAKKAEFDQARAALNPRLAEASTSQHQTLAELNLLIADLTTRMEDAAVAEEVDRRHVARDLWKHLDAELRFDGLHFGRDRFHHRYIAVVKFSVIFPARRLERPLEEAENAQQRGRPSCRLADSPR